MKLSDKGKSRVISTVSHLLTRDGKISSAASQLIQSAIRTDAKDDDEGRWVTTEKNHKLFINGEGEPTKGNPHVLSAAKGEAGPEKSASSTSNASKTETATKKSNSGDQIHPSPEKPQKPSLKKCKKASDAALEEIGGEYFEKATPDTWEYEFSGKKTAKSAATSILNSLRKNGFDAVFTTASGKVSEKPTSYLWVRDPKNDYNFVEYSVYKSSNTAPGKTYLCVDIKQTY